VFLDEILQPKQVGPGRGEDRRSIGGALSAFEGGSRGAGMRRKTPAVIAGRRIFEKRPFARHGGETALRVAPRPAGRMGGAQRGPIQTEVLANAGVSGDTQIIFEQKSV
jgi:hypothetical protein